MYRCIKVCDRVFLGLNLFLEMSVMSSVVICIFRKALELPLHYLLLGLSLVIDSITDFIQHSTDSK